MVSPFLPDPERLRAVREALPAAAAGIYLNTAHAGPLPAETAAAVTEIAEHELRFGRAHPADAGDAEARREEARAALAAVVSTDVGTIALTRGSADALSVAVRGVDWAPGDELVTVGDPGDELERAARGLAERRGVRIVRVDPADDRPLGEALAEVVERGCPRLVAIPHVDATGRLLPVRDVSASIRSAAPDAPLVVDGRLAAGAIPVAVDELGADAYAIAGDAWLLGPSATGGLWLSASGRTRLRPDLAGADAITAEGSRADDARAFEPGDLPTPAVVGLARSVGWLSMFVGLGWAFGRTTLLARSLLERLAAVPGVEVLTPTDASLHVGVAVFRIGGWSADEAIGELGRRAFAILGAVLLRDGPAIRASTACFNDPGEIGRFVEAVELLASHTPDTLPRRTALTILHG